MVEQNQFRIEVLCYKAYWKFYFTNYIYENASMMLSYEIKCKLNKIERKYFYNSKLTYKYKKRYLLFNSGFHIDQSSDHSITKMSLQSSRFIGNSSSSNILQTFNNRNFHDHMNQSVISKKENLYKTEAVNFLKTSIGTMIKDELKGYRLQKKLEKELEEYKKTKDRKQMIDDMHKIQKFRQKESEQLKAKFDHYQRQKQKKQNLVDELTAMKKQMARRKKQQHDRKIQYVRKRFINSQTQDTQNRLSRADSTLSHRSIHNKENTLPTSRARNTYTSVNQRRLTSTQTEEEQQKRITNYLKKMKHAQSRIIEKQLNNEQRKQKSIKSEVKNLTKERNQKEQNTMKQWEERLDQKMGSFYQNYSRSQLEQSSLLMNKSRIKEQLREKVIKTKEFNDNHLVNKTLDNFMRKKADKQNLYKNHQRKIDLLRTKSSFINNAIQIQKLQLEKESEKNIRILYEKMMKIKNLKQNQTLSEKERQGLLNLFDAEDPFYPEMVEFLSNTKSEFLRKKLEKEQQKAKADKTKKTARFNNKN